jgi:phospholipid-transporting ATPase
MDATTTPLKRSRTQGELRTVDVLKSGHSFCDNKVVTSHYTIANFVPKNLIEQLSKPANLYFVYLMVLQCMPYGISTTGRIPTISLPLLFIFCLNGLKDLIEDYRRHKSDELENERLVSTVTGRAEPLKAEKWLHVRVGDLVVVRNNEYIPADLVLLASSDEQGVVYVETANLDGETNLKAKQAPADVCSMVGRHETAEAAVEVARCLEARVDCDCPNEFLYSFMGTLQVGPTEEEGSNNSSRKVKVALDEEKVILRGCKLKNVKWALGVPVYTGRQTKIMMNSKARKGRKISHLEWAIAKFVGVIFIAQNVLVIFGAFFSATFDTSESNTARRYLNLTNLDGEAHGFWFVLIVRYFNITLLFANFIPISLLVSVNMVKLFQVFFIAYDAEMVHNGIYCMPRTSDLNEEMGQVDYVFSDKTGTLTCNVMDFRKFAVGGIIYGEGMTEIKKCVMLKKGQQVVEPPTQRLGARRTPHVDLEDRRLDGLLKRAADPHCRAVRDLLLHLAINHEAVVEVDDNGNGASSYAASSPDEAALCYGAKHFGHEFVSRDSQYLTVDIDGVSTKVRLLAILKFNSARKRSSVVVEFKEGSDIRAGRLRHAIYTKGADSVILARVKCTPSELQRTEEINGQFAEDGLRTLCLAGRDLQPDEVQRWLVKYEEASLATTSRQERLDQVADEIETDLELHGITGIEDRIQDGVGNCISKLADAGIKLWMLTGDKVETAINIGIATGLLDPSEGERGRRLVLTSADFQQSGSFNEAAFARELHQLANDALGGATFEGMVIDGKCLEVALEPESELDFCAIARKCMTVVCCRVSPKQKGAVVRLIKRREKAITLAIGDGANDCNMIQSADVGIGIRGLEGLQAFNVCDYGIAQFRFLENLLLVHGRWCYRRVAILANYMFYKNIVVVLPQYFLGCVSMFSGQKLYNDFMYQTYNVVHSALPIVLFGVLDQDVPKRWARERPGLYALGRRSEYLNFRASGCWVLSGVWHAWVIFAVPYFTMSNGNVTHSDGKANDLWLVGSMIYLLAVIVVNLQCLLETCFVNRLTLFGIAFSLFWWFLLQAYFSGLITGSVTTSELHGSLGRLFGCPMLWLVIATATALALLADMQSKGIRCSFFPSVLHQVQQEVLEEARKCNTRRRLCGL